MTIVDTKDTWPLRPGIVGRTLRRWLGHELKISDGLATMAHGGADAVCARISSSDHNDIFASGCDEFGFVPVGFELSLFGEE